jgi:hypothetical protein
MIEYNRALYVVRRWIFSSSKLSERVTRGDFFQSTKTQNTPFPPEKSSKVLDPNQRRKSKRYARKWTFPAHEKIFTRVIMAVYRQKHQNEVSLIVGNLAAAIAAENEREATPHTPGYTRTRRRQFVVDVYRNLGPSYFRRAYQENNIIK